MDAVLYVDLVQTGNFYEYLMREGNVPLEKRQSFKRQFFGRVFFCKDKPQTEEAKLFDGLFPSVYGVVKAIKGKDYTVLSKLLQKVESSLVINKVVRRCMAEIPETFVSTIHDSIMTTPDGVGPVKKILLEEFARIGLEPGIKEEHCDVCEAHTRAA